MTNDNWNGFYFIWLNQTGLSGYFLLSSSISACPPSRAAQARRAGKRLMQLNPINPVDPVKENENIIESIH
jgi:hypothetical protein